GSAARAPGRPAVRAGRARADRAEPAPAGLAAGRAPPRLASTQATRVPATPARLATAPATRNRSIFCDGKPPFWGAFFLSPGDGVYSAAATSRQPRCRRQRSIHSFVSFSCAPFWDRRRRKVRKSTRSRSWSWLKQENTTVSVPVTG